MSRSTLLDVFALPEKLIELVGIADTDVLKGTWYLGTMDPRETIDELRKALVELSLNKKDNGDVYVEARELGCQLAELAIGAAAIRELPSNSDTIRYVFGTIEKYRGDRDWHKRPEPGPFFVDLFQMMVLAAKPKQRNDIFEAVGRVTGLNGPIIK